MHRLTSVLFVILIFSQTACFGGKIPPIREDSTNQIRSSITTISRPLQTDNYEVQPLPFSLYIIEELYDGKRLFVQGRLESETSWSIDDLAIRLLSLSQGETIGVSEFALADLLVDKSVDVSSTDLSKGRPVDFLVWTEADDISDYQLEVLWGEEARKSTESSAIFEESDLSRSQLEIKNIEVEIEQLPCERGDTCLANFKVFGELYNTGSTPVSFVVLAVGIKKERPSTDADSTIVESSSEEIVEITNIALQPGGSRELRLSLESQVRDPSRPIERPYLRIVSFGGPQDE